MHPNLIRKITGEALGSMFLLTAVVGSGIMAERLADGNVALALLANAIATGATLIALILAFAPISGAHFNPAVTLAEAWQRKLSWLHAATYVFAQVLGAFAGVALAHLMFQLPIFFSSSHERTGASQWIAELIATFGLVGVMATTARHSPRATPYAVGAFITAAYWFTSSTSFANPAVTLARAATDTFTGIRPVDVPAFLIAQLAGAFLAAITFGWLMSVPSAPKERP